MAWPKGMPRPPGSGRRKGTPNKAPVIREALAAALNARDPDLGELGGVEYLRHLKRNFPGTFARLLAKTIPAEVNATAATEVIHRIHLGPKPE